MEEDVLREDALKGGEKELLEFKDLVQSLEQAEKAAREAEGKEKEKIKQIDKREKEIEKAISDNELAERNLIANPFDKEIEELEKNKKDSISDKGKKKQEEIKRLGEEATLHLREKNKESVEKMKVLAEEDAIPAPCRSKLFYAFYYPLGITDYLVLTICLVLWFAVLPLLSRFGLYQAGILLSMSDIYLIFVLLFFVVYILINNFVKEKHMDAYRILNEIREEILGTNKEIRTILSSTKKTPETELGLEEFDSKVQELDAALIDKRGSREKSLMAFDENKEAKEERATVIRGQHQDALDQLKAELEKLTADREQKEAIRNELQSKLDSDYYKPLLAADKNIRKNKVLEELFLYLRTGEAKTIADAIEKRRNPKAQKEVKEEHQDK